MVAVEVPDPLQCTRHLHGLPWAEGFGERRTGCAPAGGDIGVQGRRHIGVVLNDQRSKAMVLDQPAEDQVADDEGLVGGSGGFSKTDDRGLSGDSGGDRIKHRAWQRRRSRRSLAGLLGWRASVHHG